VALALPCERCAETTHSSTQVYANHSAFPAPGMASRTPARLLEPAATSAFAERGVTFRRRRIPNLLCIRQSGGFECCQTSSSVPESL